MVFNRGNASIIIISVLAILLVISATAAGYLYLQSQNQIPPVQYTPPPSAQPTVQPSPAQTTMTTTQNETANWKTYTNSQFGFSVKYPPDWFIYTKREGTLAISKGAVGPEPMTHGFIGAFVISGAAGEQVYLDAKNKKPWEPYGDGNAIDRIEKITFLGQSAIKNVQFGENPIGDPQTTSIAFVYKGSTILIAYPNEFSKTLDSKTFNQILSTFKFTQ